VSDRNKKIEAMKEEITGLNGEIEGL